MNMLEKMELLMKNNGIKNNAELSRVSEIPYTTIDGFYKKGTENIRRSTLLKLAKTLGCSLDYLVDDDFECQTFDFAIDKLEPNPNSLTPSEQKLLGDYRSLNDEGREKVEDYAEDLAASGRYIKNYSAEMGEEKAN